MIAPVILPPARIDRDWKGAISRIEALRPVPVVGLPLWNYAVWRQERRAA